VDVPIRPHDNGILLGIRTRKVLRVSDRRWTVRARGKTREQNQTSGEKDHPPALEAQLHFGALPS
jgi:hypothetical protein